MAFRSCHWRERVKGKMRALWHGPWFSLCLGAFVVKNLMRSIGRDDGYGSLQENFDIEPEGPGAGVLDVHPDHVVEFDPASAVDLPESGDSGFGGQEAAAVPDAVAFHFVGERRARADERHVTEQDVEELGQLVEAGFAEKAADGGDAGVGCDFVSGGGGVGVRGAVGDEAADVIAVDGGIAVHAHGTELEELETAAVLTEAVLAVENGSSGGELHGEGDGGEQRQAADEGEQASGDVHGSLEDTRETSGSAVEEEVVINFGLGSHGFSLAVQIFGKDVESEPDFVDLSDGEGGGQGIRDFSEEGGGDGVAIDVGAQFREDHAEGGTFLVPTFGVGIAAGAGEGEEHVIESVEVALRLEEAA